MKKLALIAVAALAVLVVTGDNAWAHDRFRGHIGIYFGAPWAWGPYPYYPPAPIYVEPAPAPVAYVQRWPEDYARPPSNYWYYCPDARAYYPYVSSCPAGWMQVLPQDRPPQ